MPDTEATDDLFGTEATDSLFGEADPLGTPEQAADYARNEEAARPNILGGGVPVQQPFNERPWHEQLTESASDSPVAQPLFSLLENAGAGALGQFSDEIASGLNEPGVMEDAYDRPDRIGGYEGIRKPPEDPKEYAAGSRFEDNRQTMEAEKSERDEENPVPAVVGQVIGGAALGAALPQGPIASGLTAAGQLGANLVGSGSGDLGERAEQAQNWVEEHPFLTTAGVAAPAAVGAAGPALQRAAGAARKNQYANRVVAVTTPQQRTALAANKGGQDAIYRLGQDIEEQGLHKPSDKWWNAFLPAPKAQTYYENASKARIAGNEAMEWAEDQIVAQGNPKIEVGSIADDLDRSADTVERMWDQSAAVPEANFRRNQAAGIRKGTEVQPEGPPQLVEETQEQLPDWLESTSQEAPAPAVTKEVYPEPIPTGEAPFSEALANRRYYDNNTNFTSRGGYEGAGAQEQVRRQIGNQLRRNIETGLESSGLDKGLINTWKNGKKKYSVAATIEDPALSKMQGDYGGTFGLRDMAAAHVAGLGGPAALAAAGATKGRGPSLAAASWKEAADTLEHAASASSPATTAAALRQKNEDLKNQITEAGAEQGNNWYEDFLGVY